MSKRFIANLDSVAAESFDGEMVAINIERGTYFSFSGSAPVVWQMLQTPKTVEELCGAFIPAPNNALNIRSSIQAFLDTLIREDCVKEIQPSEAHDHTIPASAPQPFIEPQVRIFNDLKDLIAIDPVHEADEFEGWPHRPPLVKHD